MLASSRQLTVKKTGRELYIIKVKRFNTLITPTSFKNEVIR